MEEAEGMGLEIGNTVSPEYGFRRLGGNRLMGKALDDRALVLIRLEAMRRLVGASLVTSVVFFALRAAVGR